MKYCYLHMYILLYLYLLLCLLKLIVCRPLSILNTPLVRPLSSLNIIILQAVCYLATGRGTVTGLLHPTFRMLHVLGNTLTRFLD